MWDSVLSRLEFVAVLRRAWYVTTARSRSVITAENHLDERNSSNSAGPAWQHFARYLSH
jgi:hypothetical protein